MTKHNFLIVIQDILKIIIISAGFLYFSYWFYQTVYSYIYPDPRNLYNLNEYIIWISLIPLTGLSIFGYQLYLTIKRIKAANNKRNESSN
jgi:hypothetical protein